MDDTTANFVNLADAAARVLSRLNRFIYDGQNIPSDVCDLRDDVDRLSSLLENVRHTVTVGQPVFLREQSDAVRALTRDVASAWACLDATRLLIRSLPGQNKPGLGGSKIGTLPPLWKSAWSKRRLEIAQVRASIRESTQNILSRLLHLNVTVSADTHAFVYQQERHLQDFQRHLVEHVDTRLDKLSSAIQRIGAASSSSLVVRDTHNEARFQRLEALLSAAAVPAICSTSPSPSPRKHVQRSSRRCRCVCHSRSVTRYELSTFANALGSFSFGYVTAGQLCKHNCCTAQNRPTKNLRITYTFPSWLFHTAITAVFTDLPSPELLLRIHRRIPARFDIFHSSLNGYAALNNIDEARRCLRLRLGAVSDIMDESGLAPLDFALRDRHLDMAILLVREGADIFQDTSFLGASCIMFIQDIYENPGLLRSGPDWRELEQLLPMDRVLDHMDLSVLHEVVLNIRHTDIKNLLEQELCPIDACDIAGQTALYYATARGDTYSVEALLAAGARPDVSGPDRFEKVSPLAEACRHGFVDIALLLMSAGADVNVPYVGGSGWGGWYPMHRLCGTGGTGEDAIQIAAELLRRGADVHAEDGGLGTPLHQACYHDLWELVDFFIAAGADKNHRDKDGTTPLECAVAYSACQAATTLLRHGVNHTNIDEYGHNVLHHLGFYSNAAMMQVFIDEDRLSGLDVARKNMHGKTPLQLFNSRANITEHLRATFERLMDVASGHRLRESSAGSVDEEDDGDNDVFFDAPVSWAAQTESSTDSKQDACCPDTIVAPALPILETMSASLPSELLHDEEFQSSGDIYVDTNKYRFLEHTNDNGTKVSVQMLREHLEREAGPLPSPAYIRDACPSPRRETDEVKEDYSSCSRVVS